DDGPAVAHGADETDVVIFALEVESAAERRGLHECERRVLCQGDGARGLEGAQHIDHADAADDDRVSGKDRNVGQTAAQRIGAEVDDDRLGDAGTADGDDVAGRGGKAAGDGEDIQQTA